MTETVTCSYDSAEKVQNTMDDLVATGSPEEKIYIDEETNQLKVMIPAIAKPKLVEILNRHNPIRWELYDAD